MSVVVYVGSSRWVAMEHQNKLPPRGHWHWRRGLDVGMTCSDWWRG